MSHFEGFLVHGLVRDRSGGFLVVTGFAVGAAHPQFRDPDGFGVVFCGFADGAAHPQFQMPVLPLCSKTPGEIILPGGLVLDLF